MESNQFQTVTELNKSYELIRNDILKRHNIKPGTKVRLKNAIMLYKEFNGTWLKMTSIKMDMIDRIKMDSVSGVKSNYMLKAMV